MRLASLVAAPRNGRHVGQALHQRHEGAAEDLEGTYEVEVSLRVLSPLEVCYEGDAVNLINGI